MTPISNLQSQNIRTLGTNAKAWPFVEARKILEKINHKTPPKGYVLFETGYGPSGLPHIGTFGEVARTSMVRYAFSLLSDIPTKLFAFSDDLDGLRKVPSNVPNQELLQKYLQHPLTLVPDPFQKYASFGEHNNEMLKEFLNKFSFNYDFISSTTCYKSGAFDKALLRVLEHYDEICKVILPTLGDERRSNYSPFLPICKDSGKVLQVEVINKDIKKGTITYFNEQGKEVETLVTGGNCKLQWKVDWGMRWYALDVDYEMSGKDLIPSVILSSKICKILGKSPPLNLTYELFLDKNGEKISKSKGNGLSIDDWLRYGNKESLSYFMYQKPQTAKRLYLEIITRNVDEWLASVSKYYTLDDTLKVESPVFFIHNGSPPKEAEEITFTLILNLVAVLKSTDKKMLWQYMKGYKNFNNETRAIVDDLMGHAINYYHDFIVPTLNYKILNPNEAKYLQILSENLLTLEEQSSGEQVQRIIYQTGKDLNLDLKNWFKLLYESLLGQTQGPRMGSFFVLYGIGNSIQLIKQAIERK